MDRRPAAFAATRTQDALTWRHQVSSAGHTESRSSAQAGMEPSPCARSSRRRPSTPTRLRRAESRPNLSTNPQPAAKNAPRPDRAAPAVHHWAAVCRHFLDAPTSHSDPTPSACPPVPQSTSQEPANRRFAGTSKRLKGLEPSTFCMASRPRSNGWAELLPANRGKAAAHAGRVQSQISPRFAGVLSTNRPPRCEADRASGAVGALPSRLLLGQVEVVVGGVAGDGRAAGEMMGGRPGVSLAGGCRSR
jgi:hypothetical protein